MTMTETLQNRQDAGLLRAALVEQLITDGAISTPRVEDAMRAVPRHEFTPGVDVETAYQDDVVRYQHDGDGVCVSSVSAPWMVAMMLEAAEITPGMKVLEIGSGGYGAALLSHLVGGAGRVVSVDIDPQVALRAMGGLAKSRYTPRVAVADGAYGLARFAPYDRIIATMCSREVPRAWVEQLTEAGRIVMPLEVRAGQQRIISFDRDGDLLHARALFYGGFVRMRGVGAHRPHRVEFDDGGSVLELDDGDVPDEAELDDVLSSTAVEMPTGVTVAVGEPYDDLQLYLAVALPRVANSLVLSDEAARGLPLPQRGFPVLAAGAGSIAYLTVRQISEGPAARFELVACGLGPLAALAASELAGQVGFWEVNLRGAGDPEICISSIGPVPEGFEDEHTIVRQHSTIHIAFPTASEMSGGSGE